MSAKIPPAQPGAAAVSKGNVARARQLTTWKNNA